MELSSNGEMAKKPSFAVSISHEIHELIEVVGAHLTKFRQSAIKQIQILKDIWKCKTTVVDLKNKEHENLLIRLFKNIFPNDPIPQIPSKDWKKLGFQEMNPEIDFRKSDIGLLGLLNLVYFSEKSPNNARTILASNHDYPWAVSALNITNLSVSMLKLNSELVNSTSQDLRWHSPLYSLFYFADNEDTFDELYSQAVLLFDSLWKEVGLWKEEEKNYSYIIERLQFLLEEILLRKPLNLQQFLTWINQIQISI